MQQVMINGRPNDGYIAISSLSQRAEQTADSLKKIPGMKLIEHDHEAWAPLSNPQVSGRAMKRMAMPEGAVLASEFVTAHVAAQKLSGKKLLVTPQAVIDAMAGQRALVMTMEREPAYPLEMIREAVAHVPPTGAPPGKTGQALRYGLMAAGALVTAVAGYSLSNAARGYLETSAESESRKTGVLAAATLVAGATGIGGTAAWKSEFPRAVNGVRGVTIGAGLLLALTATRIAMANSTSSANATTSGGH